MISFSAWSLYPKICFSSRQQGTNVLLNIFGGTIVNAAAGLASTTLTILEQFATNILMASRPQIIKLYAQGNINSMVKLLKQTSLISNMLFAICAIPFIAEIDYILSLWLVNVPAYTSGFCVTLIIGSFITLNNNVIYSSILASGKITLYSITAGTTSILVLPVLYFIFKNGGSLYYAYGIPIIVNILIYFYCLAVLKKITKTVSITKYIRDTLGISLLLIIIPSMCLWALQYYMPSSFLRLLVSVCLSTSVLLIIAFKCVLPKSIKQFIITKIKNRF